MDFSKFRGSGDLSDITVSLDGEDFKLHKFPLYAKSDYFCELARKHPRNESDPVHVELMKFPGGVEVFGLVADFCYNMQVNLSRENIVAVKCAAVYLKMYGPGNLVDMADKFLAETLSSAKLSRGTALVISLLTQCKAIGELAHACGLVSTCIEALAHTWGTPSMKYTKSGNGKLLAKNISSSAFRRVQAPAMEEEKIPVDDLDEASIDCLIHLPPEWLAKILIKAADNGVSVEELGGIGVRFISILLDIENRKARKDNENLQKSASADDKDSSLGDTEVSEITESKLEASIDDIGHALDTVLVALPDQAFDIPQVTIEWLTKVLRLATTLGCKSRRHLVKAAGEMLSKLSPEELCIISPSVLHDIIQDANTDGSGDAGVPTKTLSSDSACKLVDTYLSQMCAKGVLTSESFKLLASATKDYPRISHDSLYDVLEFVLKSEASKLTQEQCNELSELVNFDLLSESSLQRALDSNVMPAARIASSALQLCSKLRSELASIKYIAEMQEQDIQKYQITASAISSSSKLPPDSPPAIVESLSARSQGYGDSMVKPSSLAELHDNEEELEPREESDPVRAAQNVLSAARHRLSMPMYTGYRHSTLSRLHSPNHSHYHQHVTSNSNHHLHNDHHLSHAYAGHREHDITAEEELEFKVDRSFRSLDPRVRHHNRLSNQLHFNYERSSGQRPYFPYTKY